MSRDLQQARAKRLLQSLFPDVGPWTAAVMSVETPTAPAPTTLLGDEFATLRRNRMLSATAQYLQRRPDAAGPQVRSMVQGEAFAETVHSHTVTRNAATVRDELARQGLTVTVVKGPALAQWYRVPSSRSFGDVDLVVSPDRFSSTLTTLLADGWNEDPTSRQPWPFFHRWCRESVNLHRDGTAFADLHHRPSPWVWTNGLDGRALARRSSEQQVSGVSLPCADLADNALVAALQLITDHRAPGSKLVAWRDLAELANVAPEAVAVRANDVGLGGIVRCLVTAMPGWLRPPEVLDVLDADIAHPIRLVTLLESAIRGSYVRNHMARLPAMNAILYAAGTVVPSRAFLTDRYPAQQRRLVTWWRELADQTRAPV